MQNQKPPYMLQILLFLLLPVVQASPFLGLGILDTIEGLLGATNSSLAAGLTAFLGDHGSVIFQNGLMDEKTNRTTTNCPRMAIIFARGTNEPGNVGILAGPPFFAAIAEYMNGTNQLAIQGVNYEAQPVGFFAGGSATGATMMATLINNTLSTCPGTPLLLSGYSQGAQLVHLATTSLPSNTTSKIASIVLFGDPNNGTVIQGVESARVRTFCHAGDDICKGGDAVLKDHLTYAKDARTAAMWAMGSVAELGITSMRMNGGIGG
ncbi:cutinase-domain-containing protein [Cadophora sp. MPI-SDFR-AT-0126]|nr:cutinase-domain-containing protein [Leotiomycetes sp. MPI-SDFR-AT-0126]